MQPEDIEAIKNLLNDQKATLQDIQRLLHSILGNKGEIVIQRGKYNVVARGKGFQIGDRSYNYQETDPDIVLKLREALNKVVIDNSDCRLSHRHESSEIDWNWAKKLLSDKQLPEINLRLSDTLGRDYIQIDVSLEERLDLVNRPNLKPKRTLLIDGKDCKTLAANESLIDIFDREDVKGHLLILGAPGAGKTTEMLLLAKQLVLEAIEHRRTIIPVIFELSNWRNDSQSIESWLIEQLYALHGTRQLRKSKVYEKWLEQQVLLPLMDGLDELGLERQKKCSLMLNEFAESYPYLVVCSRIKEFEEVKFSLDKLGKAIPLRNAVCIQPLSDSQIQNYLKSIDCREIWEVIETVPSLQALLQETTENHPGLLRIPLFLRFLVYSYNLQGTVSNKLELLEKYIKWQLSYDRRLRDRCKELKHYKWAYKTIRQEPSCLKVDKVLTWIAQNLQRTGNNNIDFLLEEIQPTWIKSNLLRHIYKFIFGLVIGFIVGLNFPLPESIVVAVVTSFIYLIIGERDNGLIIICVAAVSLCLINILIQQIPVSNMEVFFLKNIFEPSIRNRLTLGFALGILTIGLTGNIANIETVEEFQFKRSNLSRKEITSYFRRGAIKGACVGISIMLIAWILSSINPLPTNYNKVLKPLLGVTLIFSLLGGIMNLELRVLGEMKTKLETRFRPNVGIRRSFWNQVVTTLILLVLASLYSIYSQIPYNPNFYGNLLSIAIVFSFNTGGGKACLQHLSLRIVLWLNGLPWNLERFLDYCYERRLLLRVGGRYRFFHLELLEHFNHSDY